MERLRYLDKVFEVSSHLMDEQAEILLGEAQQEEVLVFHALNNERQDAVEVPKVAEKPKNFLARLKEILPPLKELLEQYKNTNITEKAPYSLLEQKILLRILVNERTGKKIKGINIHNLWL